MNRTVHVYVLDRDQRAGQRGRDGRDGREADLERQRGREAVLERQRGGEAERQRADLERHLERQRGGRQTWRKGGGGCSESVCLLDRRHFTHFSGFSELEFFYEGRGGGVPIDRYQDLGVAERAGHQLRYRVPPK